MAYSYGAIQPAVTSKPLAVFRDASISSSTQHTLNTASTGVELTAPTQHAVLFKWDGTVSTSDFDGVVNAYSTKVFTIPRGTTTINFIQDASGASIICVEF